MKRPLATVILIAAIAIASLLTIQRNLVTERAKNAALLERVAALEPVEAGGSSQHERIDAHRPDALDHSRHRPQAKTLEERPSIAPSPQGSLHARKYVAQLQRALLGGTPLQEYQVRALIAEIDRIDADIADERARDIKHAADWKEESRRRLREAALDILFESQLDAFLELSHPDDALQ